ncbi:MAG: hypothetical protein B7733_25750 [Myxococcales bacterium FL481]|nr:MAG: hypothetical protein B7733_25750 [Myxococcales bacterium FL481]
MAARTLPQSRPWWSHASILTVGSLLFSVPATSQATDEPSGHLCSDAAQAVATDHRGRILVAGTAYDNRVLEWPAGHAHYGDLAISRLYHSGRRDRKFGDRGTVIVDLDDFDDAHEIVVGRHTVDVIGTTSGQDGATPGPADIVVLRLDHRGRGKKSFGYKGLATFDLGGSESIADAARARKGGLYVAGSSAGPDGAVGFVAKIGPRGKLVRGFGDNGVFTFDTGSPDDRVLGIKPVRDGIIVGAQTSEEGVATAVAFKISHRGRMVHCYGEDAGMSTVSVGGSLGFAGTAFHNRAGAMAVSLMTYQDDGAAVASTVLFDEYGHVLEGPDGPAFSLDIPGGAYDAPTAGGFWWGETLFLAGATYPVDFATGDAFITRVDESGVVDESFGGGIVTEHLELEYAAFNDLALGRRSGVLAAGWEFSEGDETLPLADALLVRYRNDGSLDPRFGRGTGVVLHDFNHGREVCGPVERIAVGDDDDHDDHDDHDH